MRKSQPSQRPVPSETMDAYVAWIESFQRIAKTDPEFFEGLCEYFSSETKRFGEVHAKALKNPQSDSIQETLNLNRRLSIMSHLLSYLRMR